MSYTVPSMVNDSHEDTLNGLFRILLRYWPFIGTVVIGSLLFACVSIFMSEPQYETSGQIMVAPASSSLLTDDITGQYKEYSDRPEHLPINNIITRMRGASVADSVVVKTMVFATIGLPGREYHRVQYFSAVPPGKPRVFTIIPQRTPGTGTNYLVMDENGTLAGTGKYDVKFSCPAFAIILSPLGPVKSIQIRLDPVPVVRRRILSSVRISNIRNSDIIEVSCRSTDPARAKLIVNGFISEIEYRDLLEKRQKATALRTFLENQLREVSSLLENAEDKYLDTKLSSGIVSVSEQTRQYIDLLRFLEERRIDYELRLAEASSAREKAASVLAGSSDMKNLSKFTSSPFFRDNTLLQELYSRVATLQISNAKLKSMYNATHPLVLQSNAELDAARKELDDAVSTTVSNATKGVDPILRPVLESQLTNDINMNVYRQILTQVKKEIRNLNRTIETLPKSEVEKARYERNVGVNQRIHDILLTRLEEARIMEASTISDIRIINRAELPQGPVTQRRARVLLFAVILGLCISGTVVIGCEYAKSPFDTVENIEKTLGAPVLGLIPRFATDGTKKRRILTDPEEESAIKLHSCEIFNSLLIHYMKCFGRKGQKTVIITSAVAREGKSIIAANLAVTMARAGKRVLLVDCDLRKPVLHTMFNLPNDRGLTDLVQNGAREVFLKTQYPNLVFLSSGNVSDVVPAELLHSPNFRDTIRMMERRLDFIVIDTPPVLLYTDAVVLSSHFRNSMLVLKSGTNANSVMRAKDILERADGHVVGTVVNSIKKSLFFGDLYSHNGYGYGYSYPEEPRESRKKSPNPS